MLQLKYADQESRDDVDGGDQNRGEGVALAETSRAVHRSVKFRFACDLFAAGARLRFVDQTGIHVRVDGHLLSGQSIQSEAGGHFRGAHSAMVDDQILNRDQREEDHEAHDVVAADDELPEGLDHVACRRRAFVAVQKNAAAAGDIQRNAEQGQKQQQGRENGKLDGLQNV